MFGRWLLIFFVVPLKKNKRSLLKNGARLEVIVIFFGEVKKRGHFFFDLNKVILMYSWCD